METLRKLDLETIGISKELQIEQKLILFLRANGLTEEEIASKLDVDKTFVHVLLSTKSASEKIVRLQRAIFRTPQDQLNAVAPLAVEKMVLLMQHAESEAVQKAAATDLLDRAMGKPTQTTISANFNIPASPEAIDDNLQQLNNRLAALEAERQKLTRLRVVN